MGNFMKVTMSTIVLSVLLVAPFERARANDCLELAAELIHVDKVVGLKSSEAPDLAKFRRHIQDVIYAGNADLALHGPFIATGSLLEKLEYLSPLLNDGKTPTYILDLATRKKVDESIEALVKGFELKNQTPKNLELMKEAQVLLPELKKYLADNDLTNVQVLSLEQARNLTKSSFNRAIGNELLLSEEMTVKQMSEAVQSDLAAIVKQAPVEWENGHIDQGYKLKSKASVESIISVKILDGSSVGYKVVVSAKAKSPEDEVGMISQVYYFDHDFKLATSEIEEFN